MRARPGQMHGPGTPDPCRREPGRGTARGSCARPSCKSGIADISTSGLHSPALQAERFSEPALPGYIMRARTSLAFAVFILFSMQLFPAGGEAFACGQSSESLITAASAGKMPCTTPGCEKRMDGGAISCAMPCSGVAALCDEVGPATSSAPETGFTRRIDHWTSWPRGPDPFPPKTPL